MRTAARQRTRPEAAWERQGAKRQQHLRGDTLRDPLRELELNDPLTRLELNDPLAMAPVQAKLDSSRDTREHGSGGIDAPSGGAPLPAAVRAPMERAFGASFAGVRVSIGDDATRLGARAYTRGETIRFAPGHQDFSSEQGRALLGHELTHVLQQRGRRVAMPQASGAPVNADPGLEAEADALGASAARGDRVRVTGGGGTAASSSAPVQCAPLKGFRRWMGKHGGPAIGKSGRQGRDEASGGGGGSVAVPTGAHGGTEPTSFMPEEVSTNSEFENGENDHRLEDSELNAHMTAYRRARFYHSTKPANAAAILESGLDPSRGKEDGLDALEGHKRPIDYNFLGGDAHTAMFYRGKQGRDATTLRAFLTREQYASVTGDIDSPDQAAYKTEVPIAPEQIMSGKFKHQKPEKLESVFGAVRDHYPEHMQDMSIAEVQRMHAAAIRMGYTKHEFRQPNEKPSTPSQPDTYYEPGDDGYDSE